MPVPGRAKIEKSLKAVRETPGLRRLHNEFLQGEKFGLVLGAGCSMHCGVPDFNRLRKLIVAALSGNIHGSDRVNIERVDGGMFEELWSSAGPRLRHTILSNWILDRPPHLGAYYLLASLVRAQYFPTIVTYNIDRYLELALHSVGFDDFVTIINGCFDCGYVESIVADKSLTKILKTHGDHKHKVYALSTGEIVEFGEKWRGILSDFWSGKMILLGYAGGDIDFLRSMPVANSGDEIWFINPNEPPAFLQSLMNKRNSGKNWIPMRFEDIMETLYYGLSDIHQARLARTRDRTKKRESRRVTTDLAIVNRLGIHARAAALLVSTILRYDADAYFSFKGHIVNAKSIMGILTLGVRCGDVFTFIADGEDAIELTAAVRVLVEEKFFEEEHGCSI